MRERFRTRLAYRIAPWLRTLSPRSPTLSENRPPYDQIVWRFNCERSVADYPQTERDAMIAFLNEHDIGLVLEGTSVYVVEKDDGSRWVDTWQLVDGYPAASDAPNALKQERVVVPLVGDLPEMADAWVPHGARPASPASA